MSDTPFDKLFLDFQTALVGRYSLERELGRGGMGVVYLAREVRLDRPVAIKLLPPEFASDTRLKERFLREARTAARLSHPNIVPIHSVDEIGGFVFYVMMFVDGETLGALVAKRGVLKADDGARILREVAWALAYAHSQGVVHRDIKPANILIENASGRAMVTDFGIARLAQAGGETAVGEVLGTPEYMSPEQATAEPVDGRSDLYSLGVVGYYMMTGALPFTANTAQAMIAQHVTKAPPSVSETAKGMPRSIAMAIDKCLSKDPADRFDRGEALAEALSPSLEKSEDVPVPIRVFLDRRRMLQLIIAPALVASVGPMTILAVGKLFDRAMPLIIALEIAIAITVPALVLLGRTRRMLRLGYGAEDVAAGLRVAIARQRDEFIFENGPVMGMKEKIFRAIGLLGIVGGAALIGANLVLHTAAIVGVGFFSLYLGAILTVVTKRWRNLRAGTSRWLKFWEGRGGRLLTKLAGWKLGARAVAAGANRPTEMAISTSAEAMFASLPRDVKRSLGDVPAVLRGLEAQARAARGRIEQLDKSIGEAKGSGARGAGVRGEELIADLRTARGAAEARLGAVVAALENLRLDLLRLSAGAGGAAGITRALEAAREIGEGVDRVAEGRA